MITRHRKRCGTRTRQTLLHGTECAVHCGKNDEAQPQQSGFVLNNQPKIRNIENRGMVKTGTTKTYLEFVKHTHIQYIRIYDVEISGV